MGFRKTYHFAMRSVAFLLANALRAVAVTTTVTATTAVTTTGTGTTKDPCSGATHPCVCAAAVTTCAWLSYGHGGGRCFYDPYAGDIDCALCPSQNKCAGSPCSTFNDPCTCADSTSNCVWNTGLSQCIDRSSHSLSITPCSVCSSQPLCQLTKPTTKSFDPQHGSRGSGTNNVLQVVFSVEMKWCFPDIRTVDFWCDGSILWW